MNSPVNEIRVNVDTFNRFLTEFPGSESANYDVKETLNISDVDKRSSFDNRR
jgi:hypothetical protein